MGWRRWRKTTRRWASKPRRARARKRVMATSSEQAPAEEMHDGGAHLDRKLLFASCELNVEKPCVFPHSRSTACTLATQDVSVLPTKTHCCSLAVFFGSGLAEHGW